jgi:hypothetical protein
MPNNDEICDEIEILRGNVRDEHLQVIRAAETSKERCFRSAPMICFPARMHIGSNTQRFPSPGTDSVGAVMTRPPSSVILSL